MRENICKLYIQEAINIQNIYREKKVYVCAYIYIYTHRTPQTQQQQQNQTTQFKNGSLVIQWLRLFASTPEGCRFNPWLGN